MTTFNCKKFLKRVGMTQTQLANELGCSQSAVAMWCSGASMPPYASMVRLIELGATTEELFGDGLAKVLLENSQPRKPVSGDYESPEFRDAVIRVIRSVGL